MDYRDITGKKFGKLTVVEYLGLQVCESKSKRSVYLCQCDCGNECQVLRRDLIGGRRTTCTECVRIIKEDDHMRYICADGQSFIFDSTDFAFVNSRRWYLDKWGYAMTRIECHNYRLTRLLLDAADDVLVDHLNGNPQDNRRSNLRIVSCQENQSNMGMSVHNTSGYKGVSYRKDRKIYRAYISVDDKYVHLGHFHTPEEAARAYDEAARFYYGKFACVNFPDNGEQGCKRNRHGEYEEAV